MRLENKAFESETGRAACDVLSYFRSSELQVMLESTVEVGLGLGEAVYVQSCASQGWMSR